MKANEQQYRPPQPYDNVVVGANPGPYPPGNYAPPQGGYLPPQAMYQAPTGYSLQQMLMSFNTGVFLKQKFDTMEALTGCEFRNKYMVYQNDPNKEKGFGPELLKAKEISGCCARNFLSPTCREFNVEFENLWNNSEQCIELVRPYTCTFLCCNRPRMEVFLTEGGNKRLIGQFVDNWNFMNYTFQIQDASGNAIYHVKAGCCQKGLICKGFPCKDCQRVEFELWDANKSQQIGTLLKLGKSCLKNMFGDSDNFSIPFPERSTFEQRVLLMSFGIFIDFMMFEEKGKNNNRH